MIRKIVIEGALGDWASRKYLPALESLKKLFDCQVFLLDIRQANEIELGKFSGSYINKITDRVRYELLDNIDVVFIVTPDHTHADIAEYWIKSKGLSDSGKIIIEKPLDSLLTRAEFLCELTRKADHKVYGFDHYLGKIEAFATNFRRQKKNILGSGTAVLDFQICESREIPPNRAEALREGLALDLLPHALSVINEFLADGGKNNINFYWFDGFEVKNIIKRRYEGAPINNETSFEALLSDEADNLLRILVCKKCEDRKSFFLNADNRRLLNIDFISGHLSYSDGKFVIDKEPVKNMIEKILSDIEPIEIPGIVSLDFALESLKRIFRLKESNKRY